MQVWNVLHAENTACKNRQKIAICAPSHNFVWLYLCNEGMYRQSEKFLNSNITSTCSHNSELRPISGWDRLVSSRHPSIFQRVSRLGFVTTLTLLNGGQPNFARCLAASCAGRIFIRFEGSCPVTEFYQVQNSLCMPVLRSPILPTLLYGTWAVGVSQTLRRGTRNGITELSLRRGCHLYSVGRPSRLASAHILLCIYRYFVATCISLLNMRLTTFSRHMNGQMPIHSRTMLSQAWPRYSQTNISFNMNFVRFVEHYNPTNPTSVKPTNRNRITVKW